MIQTWLPLPDFRESVKTLSDNHLYRQRYHVLEIMEHFHEVEEPVLPPQWKNDLIDHPILKMWFGYELQLCEYGLEACEEFAIRFSADAVAVEQVNLYEAITRHMEWAAGEEAEFKKPNWFGDVDFHLSHQAALFREEPDNYINKFKVDTSLELIWPVSNHVPQD